MNINEKLLKKGIKLWENSNLTENFSAQNITLKDSDCNLLKWYFYDSTSPTSLVVGETFIKFGCNIDQIININQGIKQTMAVRERQIRFVDGNTYKISTCYEKDSTSSNTPSERTDRLIPLCVIGYKSNLF